MTNVDDWERDEQALVRLLEIHGPCKRLTEAQARVLAALAAGFSVCISTA